MVGERETAPFDRLRVLDPQFLEDILFEANLESNLISDPALAAAITRTASQQTYYTIRFLVDTVG